MFEMCETGFIMDFKNDTWSWTEDNTTLDDNRDDSYKQDKPCEV